MEKGRIFYSPFFTLRVLFGQKRTGFGALIPKKVAKTAVARNLARRRVYEAIKVGGWSGTTNTGGLIKSGTQVALICKDKAVGVTPAGLVGEIKTLLKKASVI